MQLPALPRSLCNIAAPSKLLPWPPCLQVETKTRHEIEEKKKQLRLVVGDSYRCWERGCCAAATPPAARRRLLPACFVTHLLAALLCSAGT